MSEQIRTVSAGYDEPRRVALVVVLALLAVWLPGQSRAEAASTTMWLAPAEIAALPTSGPAFEHVRKLATDPLPVTSDLGVRDQHNVQTLAAALVGVRLNDASLQAKAVKALRTIVQTTPTDDLLAASRRLGTYVIAADVLDLPRRDPALHEQVRVWAGRELDRTYRSGSGGAYTIVEVQERRPNNWGTHAGASRTAVAIYRGDRAELDAAARVFRAWLGDTSAHRGFAFGALDWQADRQTPVGINPVGARIDGRDVDGVLPDDQRRAGGFTWPPQRENYVWEALQGATVQAQLLQRQGLDAWGWQDRALVRALRWLHDRAGYPAEGDDTWIPHLVNHATGSRFPTVASRPGKNMGFTDWTHAGAAAAPSPTPPASTSPPPPPPVDSSPPPVDSSPPPVDSSPPPVDSSPPPVDSSPPPVDSSPPPVDSSPPPADGSRPTPPASRSPKAKPKVHGPHAEAIEAVLAAGIAVGYDDGSFHPERQVTRAQMATFLSRALQLEGRAGRSFRDTAGDTHARAIEAIASAGIARGYGDGRFHPNRAVDRGQMASFLTRALALEGRGGRSFTDTAGNTHARAIEAIAAAGIARGHADGTFRPTHGVTRAQMASFLARAFGLL